MNCYFCGTKPALSVLFKKKKYIKKNLKCQPFLKMALNYYKHLFFSYYRPNIRLEGTYFFNDLHIFWTAAPKSKDKGVREIKLVWNMLR